LTWAKEQKDYSNVYEVFRRTKGIIFLGTPHRGAYGSYADFGVILQRMTSIFLHQNNHHLLSSLKGDSETLERLAESFARMLNDKSFSVHSFVEELPMSNVNGMGLVCFLARVSSRCRTKFQRLSTKTQDT
jgi:protein SERAC1